MRPTSRRPLRNASTNSAYLSSEVGSRNPITGSVDCCELAAVGHATAPPSSLIKSRRFTGHPPVSEATSYRLRLTIHNKPNCRNARFGSKTDVYAMQLQRPVRGEKRTPVKWPCEKREAALRRPLAKSRSDQDSFAIPSRLFHSDARGMLAPAAA